MYEVQLIWWLPLLGTVIWMATGAMWYNPKTIGSKWMELTGFTEELLNEKIEKGEVNMGLAFGSSALAGLVMNFVLLHVAQYMMHATGNWGVMGGLCAAATCWLGFNAIDVGAHGFEGRTWKLYLIDKGWMLVAMLTSGALIGNFVAAA